MVKLSSIINVILFCANLSAQTCLGSLPHILPFFHLHTNSFSMGHFWQHFVNVNVYSELIRSTFTWKLLFLHHGVRSEASCLDKCCKKNLHECGEAERDCSGLQERAHTAFSANHQWCCIGASEQRQVPWCTNLLSWTINTTSLAKKSPRATRLSVETEKNKSPDSHYVLLF